MKELPDTILKLIMAMWAYKVLAALLNMCVQV